MDERQDAFGLMLQDGLAGEETREILERDDGTIWISGGAANYLAPFRRWIAPERRALRYVRGRVLDVGCGAGRVALELQERGHAVVAIDESPGAVEVARRRGVRDARVLRFEDVDESLGRFDTVVFFGNNFGLFGSRARAKRMLRRLARMADRIVASSNDPYPTREPLHTAYQERNLRRGRMAGQLHCRVRYKDRTTPWFDYLIVSPEEMRELAESGGWHVHRLIAAEGTEFVGVLDRD
jgi:SAM-dependent methyltransferase